MPDGTNCLSSPRRSRRHERNHAHLKPKRLPAKYSAQVHQNETGGNSLPFSFCAPDGTNCLSSPRRSRRHERNHAHLKPKRLPAKYSALGPPKKECLVRSFFFCAPDGTNCRGWQHASEPPASQAGRTLFHKPHQQPPEESASVINAKISFQAALLSFSRGKRSMKSCHIPGKM